MSPPHPCSGRHLLYAESRNPPRGLGQHVPGIFFFRAGTPPGNVDISRAHSLLLESTVETGSEPNWIM